MSFKIREFTKKSFTKAEFLNLTPGTHIVRFLEPTDDAEMVESHFVVTPATRFSVVCLGQDECPICKSNRRIIQEHPKDFRTQPGYFSKSDRYTINVLDRTPVKICPQCQNEVKKIGSTFPATCPSCSTLIASVEVHPLNKVKLMQLSKTLATQINSIENATLGPTGDPLGLVNYDVVFSVTTNGDKKTVTPIPATSNNDVVEVPKDAFLDKAQGALRMDVDEIMDALKGVSLKDIFAARKATTSIESKAEIIDIDIEAKINKELFGEG